MAPVWNWWRFSSFGFGLGAVAVAIPLAWTGWLLLRQIKTAQESNIFALMIGKGAGGTPGIADSSVAILALTATVAVFSGLSAALAEYARRRFAPGPTRKRVQPRLDNRIIDEIERRWDVGIPIAFVISWGPFVALTESVWASLGLAACLSLAFQSGDTGVTTRGRFTWITATVAAGAVKSAQDEIVSAGFAYVACAIAAITFFTWLHFRIRPPSAESQP